MDQHAIDELVADRSKGGSKVREGDVQWSLHILHVFDDGSHGGDVLLNPIHASQEAFLCGGITMMEFHLSWLPGLRQGSYGRSCQ